MDKYDPKGSFQDPIVRCFRCHNVLKTATLIKLGKCKHCGSTKVANATTLTGEELDLIKSMNIDPEYIKEWEVVDDE